MNDARSAGVYARLGVRPVVNAAATLTAVGGPLMPAEVLAAMAEAAGTHVDMHELHAAAGRRIAELTRNEAAYVTSGCAAAMALAVLGCVTEGDPRKIAQMPCGSDLTTKHGADLALFSGGKALHGPQASGFMVGRADLVAAAAVNGSPHQGLARAMKAGKEEIVGLVRAIELYLDRDHDADSARWASVVERWVADLDGVAGLQARRCFPNEAGQPVPRVPDTLTEDQEHLVPQRIAATAREMANRVASAVDA